LSYNEVRPISDWMRKSSSESLTEYQKINRSERRKSSRRSRTKSRADLNNERSGAGSPRKRRSNTSRKHNDDHHLKKDSISGLKSPRSDKKESHTNKERQKKGRKLTPHAIEPVSPDGSWTVRLSPSIELDTPTPRERSPERLQQHQYLNTPPMLDEYKYSSEESETDRTSKSGWVSSGTLRNIKNMRRPNLKSITSTIIGTGIDKISTSRESDEDYWEYADETYIMSDTMRCAAIIQV